jgi:septal ring factor EnvC (AmiA/AmiB activator)
MILSSIMSWTPHPSGSHPILTEKPACPARGRTLTTQTPLTPPISQHKLSASASTSSAPEANSSDQVRSLQRELQSQREYQRRQEGLLNRANIDKRKLDEDLARLHVTRRKLERQVDGLQDQLSKAQKSENRVRDQLQREIMLRRRAEGEAAKRRESEALHTEHNVPKCPTDALMATSCI